MKRLLSTILLAGSLAPLMGLEIWPVGLDKVGNSPNMEWSDSDGMTLKVVNSDEGKQVMNVLKLKAEDVAGKTFKVSFEYILLGEEPDVLFGKREKEEKPEGNSKLS